MTIIGLLEGTLLLGLGLFSLTQADRIDSYQRRKRPDVPWVGTSLNRLVIRTVAVVIASTGLWLLAVVV